ncbi:hypothetical protein G6F63_016288 [Rhizopus arrhizus]|nr:hypothetical protein G6F63_016288 [Rhizopus arrhizus]
MRADLLQQALPFQRKGDTSCLADQQRLAEELFKLAHLMAECADRQVHRCRRTRQVAEPGGSHETLQCMEGRSGHQA